MADESAQAFVVWYSLFWTIAAVFLSVVTLVAGYIAVLFFRLNRKTQANFNRIKDSNEDMKHIIGSIIDYTVCLQVRDRFVVGVLDRLLDLSSCDSNLSKRIVNTLSRCESDVDLKMQEIRAQSSCKTTQLAAFVQLSQTACNLHTLEVLEREAGKDCAYQKDLKRLADDLRDRLDSKLTTS